MTDADLPKPNEFVGQEFALPTGGEVVGVGTDIVEVARIAQMLEKHGDAFLSRVFTPGEIEYCSPRKARHQHYAGRWAAKEAILKALGTGWTKGIGWSDIEIENLPGGRPVVKLHGAAEAWRIEANISEVLVSISHVAELAIAFATAVREGKHVSV